LDSVSPNSAATNGRTEVYEEIVELSDAGPTIDRHSAICRDSYFDAVRQLRQVIAEVAVAGGEEVKLLIGRPNPRAHEVGLRWHVGAGHE
jgi:hypothetical protein